MFLDSSASLHQQDSSNDELTLILSHFILFSVAEFLTLGLSYALEVCD